LGTARAASLGTARSTNTLDPHLRRDLPGQGGRRRPRPAILQHRRNDAALGRNLQNRKTVTPDAHAVLLLDQAGWHLSDKLDVPDNITLMPLPLRSPELNPAENIWQFIRKNWLSNRVFKSYDDIVDHCCYAWNKLVDQPWTIMSIGLRDWAHGL
jgi:putative transposase